MRTTRRRSLPAGQRTVVTLRRRKAPGGRSARAFSVAFTASAFSASARMPSTSGRMAASVARSIEAMPCMLPTSGRRRTGT